MTNEEAREFVKRWKKAGPALEKIRREELRNLSHEDCQKQIQALLEIGSQNRQIRTTSGLIEQQRIFQKARKRSDFGNMTEAVDLRQLRDPE